jgi:hypothetical protein
LIGLIPAYAGRSNGSTNVPRHSIHPLSDKIKLSANPVRSECIPTGETPAAVFARMRHHCASMFVSAATSDFLHPGGIPKRMQFSGQRASETSRRSAKEKDAAQKTPQSEIPL